MAKAKTGIVKAAFKACLEGDVYPRLFSVGEVLTGEALTIGQELKKMGGRASVKVELDKNAGQPPENKAGFTAHTEAAEPAGADNGAAPEVEADTGGDKTAGEADAS